MPPLRRTPPPPRPWLDGWIPLALFLLTFFTTTTMGVGIVRRWNLLDDPFAMYPAVLEDPFLLLAGLPFSLPLLAILMLHEAGHYGACRRNRLRVGPPWFLPAPNLIGTFGAFLRIRSPIRDRTQLLEVSNAGPLLGLLVCLPVLWFGTAGCQVVPVPEEWTGILVGPGDLPFGSPLLFKGFLFLRFGALDPGEGVLLGPVALAGWFGLLVTALNLFPAGQLDGGHILYSLWPRLHRPVSLVVTLTVLMLGLLAWPPWLLWGLVMVLMGWRHPPVLDREPPSPAARIFGVLCLALFPLCFCPVPVAL